MRGCNSPPEPLQSVGEAWKKRKRKKKADCDLSLLCFPFSPRLHNEAPLPSPSAPKWPEAYPPTTLPTWPGNQVWSTVKWKLAFGLTLAICAMFTWLLCWFFFPSPSSLPNWYVLVSNPCSCVHLIGERLDLGSRHAEPCIEVGALRLCALRRKTETCLKSVPLLSELAYIAFILKTKCFPLSLKTRQSRREGASNWIRALYPIVPLLQNRGKACLIGWWFF